MPALQKGVLLRCSRLGAVASPVFRPLNTTSPPTPRRWEEREDGDLASNQCSADAGSNGVDLRRESVSGKALAAGISPCFPRLTPAASASPLTKSTPFDAGSAVAERTVYACSQPFTDLRPSTYGDALVLSRQ